MNMDSVRKEVEIHSVHSAHNAPIARLRARFGSLAPPTPAPAPPPRVVAEGKRHEPPPEIPAAAELPGRLPFGFPSDAVIVIADADGYTDRQMKGEPHMWTWINGPTWFYVKDYPIPDSRKATA